jgi:hypothetical protein
MDGKNFKAIYEGYKNYVFPTKAMEELAKERATTCSTCEHIKPNALLKIALPDNRTAMIRGARCNLCKCPLSAKVRQVLEGCPINKWKE